MQARLFRRLVTWLTLLLVVAAIAIVVSHPYSLVDWVKLHGYTPAAETVKLADDTTMTDKARHLFYVNHAIITPKADFRQKCPKYDDKTIIIGCYQSGQRGIYVLQVADSRLAGVEQVTAAHEMLHAAYERLGTAERKHIGALLQSYATTKLNDERIKTSLKAYETSEPGQQLNEMHSIFGSEIASLPPELETYYSQYFQSRAAVTGYAARYQAAFTSRQNSIKQYDADLATQSARIKANTLALQTQAAGLESDRERLDGYRSANNIVAYNDGVEAFNAKVNAYNDLLAQTRSLIVGYNALVAERNAIASQTVELQRAIDSSSLPQSQ